MKIFRFAALVLVAAMLNSFAQTAPVTLGYNGASAMIPLTGDSGSLNFQASINRKTRDCWYWVHFLGEKNEKQMSVRIDPDKLIYYPAGQPSTSAFAYKKPLPMETMMTVAVKVNQGIYQTVINGEVLAACVLPGSAPKKVQLKAHNCGITYKDVKWDVAGGTGMVFSLFGNAGIDSFKYLNVPEGNYELSYGFQAEFKGGSRTHYGVEIGSGNNNKERVMLVFWDNGFQMLQGSNSKWLGNVDPASFNGKHHVFSLKKTDEDFYEVYVDGKLINNFEAEVSKGGQFNFWSYGKWDYRIDSVKLVKISE